MPRTTLDIDASILRELKRLKKRAGKSLGELASELLAVALSRRPEPREAAKPKDWTARPMNARVDLEDKEAVRAVLDAQ
jgi:hypothetical protein